MGGCCGLLCSLFSAFKPFPFGFLVLPLSLAALLLALRPLSGKGILEIVASNVVIAAVAIAISADHTHSCWVFQ